MWRRSQQGSLSWVQQISLPLRPPSWRSSRETPIAIQLRTDPNYRIYDARGSLCAYGLSMGLIDIMIGAYVIVMAPNFTQYQVILWVLYLLVRITVHSACVEGYSWASRGAWAHLSVALTLPLIAPWGWPSVLHLPIEAGVWCISHLICAVFLHYLTQKETQPGH